MPNTKHGEIHVNMTYMKIKITQSNKENNSNFFKIIIENPKKFLNLTE